MPVKLEEKSNIRVAFPEEHHVTTFQPGLRNCYVLDASTHASTSQFLLNMSLKAGTSRCHFNKVVRHPHYNNMRSPLAFDFKIFVSLDDFQVRKGRWENPKKNSFMLKQFLKKPSYSKQQLLYSI